MICHLHRKQFIPGDAARIWEFFATPRNLDALTPPEVRFQIIGELAPRMYAGQMIEYRVGILPGISTRWLTEITHLREGEYFVDEQRAGPYRLWHHEHRFIPTPDARGLLMTDHITYDVGWSYLGSAIERLWIRQKLRSIFDYRGEMISVLFPLHPPIAS